MRRYIRRKKLEILESFCTEVLGKSWSSFNVAVFGANKALSILQGNDIMQYIDMTQDIIKFYNENFDVTKNNTAFCVVLNE